MSKRNIGIILLFIGIFLFLKRSPYTLGFIPYQELLWPIALAVFGLYLMNSKNYQAGLVIFYIGVSFSLYYGRWEPMVSFINSDYYWATVVMVLGFGFILQSRRKR